MVWNWYETGMKHPKKHDDSEFHADSVILPG
jgi:hypothetical protein